MTRSVSLGQIVQRTALVVALAAAAWGVSAPAMAAGPTQVGQAGQVGEQPGSVSASPQSPAEPSAKTSSGGDAASAFIKADANADGKLSKDEAARLPAISAKFSELDKNKDGSLSPSEFAAGYSAAP